MEGDGESLASKREFYQEYKSVMDMPADYYLQTISAVFQEHLLPRGLFISRGRPVECAAITRTALLTMIRAGCITEREAHKAFPVGTSHAADWYRQQLQELRNQGKTVN